jgi:hypothetical protein
MPLTQIVLNISGGIVQEVFCSDPAAEVIVVDWDTEHCSPDEPGMVTVRNFYDREHRVLVGRREVLPLGELAGTDAEAAIEEANWAPVVRWKVVA